MSLVSLANVKEYLKIATAVTTDDTMLTNIITRIEKTMKIAMQQEVEYASYTEYYDGDGTDTLLLNQFPISTITSIHDDTDRAYGSDTLISSADYVFYANEGMVQLDGLTFTEGKQNIKVVYSAGFSPIPEDIKLAAIQLSAAEYIEAAAAINVISGMEGKEAPEALRKAANEIIDKRKRIK